MAPADVVRRGAAYLANHGVQSPLASAEGLMMSVLRTDRAGVYARRRGLTTAEAKSYGRMLCRRCTGTPLQHLTGEQGFRHLILRVRPGVFVPRPETEVVVDAALEAIRTVEHPVVADLGTGAAPIALAVKDERPDASVWATDVSADAVALARENADALGLAIEVALGDLFDPLPPVLRGTLDLAVANPPYLVPEELATLPAEVLADPSEALVGSADLERRLLSDAFGWLRPGGSVVVEIGDTHGSRAAAVASGVGFADVAVGPDLAGRDRVLVGRRP
jgi:release factor glutamine methyltransferase